MRRDASRWAHTGWRLFTADDQHRTFRSQVAEPQRQHLMDRAVGGNRLVIIPDQRDRSRKLRVERLEDIAREHGHALQILRRQMGKRRALPRCKRARGETEIVKERRQIPVPLVHRIPERSQTACIQITRHQRRLACARWSSDPDDGACADAIQFAKQPRAEHDLRQPRRREFAREWPIPPRSRRIHPLRHGLVPNE